MGCAIEIHAEVQRERERERLFTTCKHINSIQYNMFICSGRLPEGPEPIKAGHLHLRPVRLYPPSSPRACINYTQSRLELPGSHCVAEADASSRTHVQQTTTTTPPDDFNNILHRSANYNRQHPNLHEEIDTKYRSSEYPIRIIARFVHTFRHFPGASRPGNFKF